MIVAGIDPGIRGALAILEIRDGRIALCSIHATPTSATKVNGRARRLYDLPAIFALLTSIPKDAALVLIERQGARPEQGVVSTCTTCFGFGAWRMGLVACGLSHRQCEPRAWRKVLSLPTALTGDVRKRAVRELCLQRLPEAHLPLDVCDAVGIALAAAHSV
jgi:Holliday junction resolvasome RuvABC endonuclease subunit